MHKKSIVMLTIIFAILFISTFSFATSANDVKSVINNGTDTIVDGVDTLGEDVRNGVGSVENGIEGAFKTDDMNSNSRNSINTNASTYMSSADGYVATRTATNAFGTNTTTTWVWIIIAIAAIVIIGTVWYYIAQDNNVE